LFSIYLIKPAPFCILDEVDAPLDDANVGKFTNMIRKFSEESQFIIVTHNKMTMNAVDVHLWCNDAGAWVSKLVPVDFRSLNQATENDCRVIFMGVGNGIVRVGAFAFRIPTSEFRFPLFYNVLSYHLIIICLECLHDIRMVWPFETAGACSVESHHYQLEYCII
jgi:hypothetical protein